jgi:hypothetical protein
VALVGLCAVSISRERNVSSADPCESYGEPLDLADLEDEYHSAIESGDNQRVRAVVAELTTRIQDELTTLSVNAPNWYAVVLCEILRS